LWLLHHDKILTPLKLDAFLPSHRDAGMMKAVVVVEGKRIILCNGVDVTKPWLVVE